MQGFSSLILLRVSSLWLSTRFSLPDDRCLVAVHLENDGRVLVLRSSQTSAVCPQCTQPSSPVHGRDRRRLADRPCLGNVVRVHLDVRRLACRTQECPRTTCAERFPMLARPEARRTRRHVDALTEVAFANGGNAGALLATRLVMPARRDPLRRLIRSTDGPKRQTPKVLGLDDVVWKKGDDGRLLVARSSRSAADPPGSGRSRRRGRHTRGSTGQAKR